jgi:hypothetical protein
MKEGNIGLFDHHETSLYRFWLSRRFIVVDSIIDS